MVTVMFIERRNVKKKKLGRKKEVKLEENQEGRKEKRRRERKKKTFQTKAYTKLMIDLYRKPRILN